MYTHIHLKAHRTDQWLPEAAGGGVRRMSKILFSFK